MRLRALLLLLVTTPACVSMLGLDSSNYISSTDALCQQYVKVCPVGQKPPADSVFSGNLGTDTTSCASKLEQNKDKLSVETLKPCIEQPACPQLLDCLLQKSLIQAVGGSATATKPCVGECSGCLPAPWICGTALTCSGAAADHFGTCMQPLVEAGPG